MSLPEPINWLHKRRSEDYIYLVSTGPLKLALSTSDKDFFKSFPEPVPKVPSDSPQASNEPYRPRLNAFWNLAEWEFYSNEDEAIQRAKYICQQGHRNIIAPSQFSMKSLAVKYKTPRLGIEVYSKYGILNPEDKKWYRQTYVVRIKLQHLRQ